MPHKPETVFANILLASKITAPRGEGRPPYVLHSVGMNTWDAQDGNARVSFAACFNLLFDNARRGFHPVSMFIEDGAGREVKKWDNTLPLEVPRARYDMTAGFTWETTLPVGESA